MKRGSKQWYDSMTVRLTTVNMEIFVIKNKKAVNALRNSRFVIKNAVEAGKALATTLRRVAKEIGSFGATAEEVTRFTEIMSAPNKRMSNVQKVSK